MNLQQRDGGRGYAGEACRLAERFGPVALQGLLRFPREAAHCRIVESGGKGQSILRCAASDFIALPIDVSSVLCLDLDLFVHFLV
jgi:hypothetical protein